MKYILTILLSFLALPAFAELPAYDQQRAQTVIMSSEQFAMSDTARRSLQKRLENAVFTMFAFQPPSHRLAETGLSFDGACVAVSVEAVQEIVKASDLTEEEVPEPQHHSHSFFDRDLDKVSSPFAERKSADKTVKSSRQFYLTTADWLTWSESFEIEIQGKRVKARLDYRDEAQNVAVLSTPQNQSIQPVDVFDAQKPIPSIVFLLLSPNSFYENMTQHVLNVTEMHQYGTANMTARNGYPIFSSKGELVGLSVGPNTARTRADIVHPGLLDRALHPQKYDRTKTEKLELKTY
ncbi:MAG: hypothetical protein J6A01_11775 [Proteobacteria bacterium]|nr:hypothetical protein [Pseudomonadota bacterium]